jgi:hypothetical protein
MFGENLQLVTIQCQRCGTIYALRVDLEDVDRQQNHKVMAQDAFVRRDGTPYLTAEERELFIPEGVCVPRCWKELRMDPAGGIAGCN